MAGLEASAGGKGIVSPDGSLQRAEIQIRRTEFDGTAYEAPTWEQMGQLNFKLISQIVESGHSFDRIVALARGGWTWARDLADGVQIPELSSIRYVSYTGVNESEEPRLVQPLADSIAGQRVLLFDEVIDSCKTIVKAKRYLNEMGAELIETAALCYKPRSEEAKPDFSAFQSNAWVVFPHEMREFVVSSSVKWRSLGLPDAQIIERLTVIGVPLEQAEFYLSKSA